MPVRETSRIVTVAGRRWQINKFDALTGCHIALKMLSKLSHVATGVLSGGLKDPAVIAMAVSTEIGSLTKQEFVEISAECLHVIRELVEVGGKDIENPIRLPDGQWAVKGLDDDALLVMALVSHSLVFNLSSYFNATALKDVKESFQGLIPFAAQTSTSMPSPQ